jgi:ribokinase
MISAVAHLQNWEEPDPVTALEIAPESFRYQAMFGVGGIGAGRFFALKEDRTLGREESRAGRFLPNRDYCKLHIISHYVKRLLGTGFEVLPIGRVGDDEVGAVLLDEMAQAGLDVRYVRAAPGTQTLYSFCFIYPDGSGGNLTTDDSACNRVEAASVDEALPEFERYTGMGLVLAAPEVPMAARRRLLELGTQYGFFRAASFVSAEMAEAVETGLLEKVDLLAVNLDEAAAAVRLDPGSADPEAIVSAAAEKLSAIHAGMILSITAGKRGSWSWDGAALVHIPIFPVEAVSTAGAGDAHLAGMIAGLGAGLELAQAQELATLVAALSVTSPHTIHPGLDGESLRVFAAGRPVRPAPQVCRLLRLD